MKQKCDLCGREKKLRTCFLTLKEPLSLIAPVMLDLCLDCRRNLRENKIKIRIQED